MTKRKAKRKTTSFSNALRTIHSQHDRIIDLLTVLRECEEARVKFIAEIDFLREEREHLWRERDEAYKQPKRRGKT